LIVAEIVLVLNLGPMRSPKNLFFLVFYSENIKTRENYSRDENYEF